MTASTSIVSTTLVIGLETHVELATRSKMFSRSANVAHPDHYDAPPNSLVDPVVAALPGVLPVMNRVAVEMSMMVGLALHCRIAEVSKWDRKNYFYPDLPKGYQISQYDLPLCADGHLDIPVAGGTKRIGIIRAHLEEDTGKLGHELPGGAPYDGSLVDLNRAGTPLLEIVSHPDLASADEAVTFARELRSICRFLGVTGGVMQRGHMRFEPNVNVIVRTDDGTEVATPIVEVKNLNSFRALRGAIEHEHERQVARWLEDGRVQGPGAKRTRGWDDARQVTVLQREKEDVHDYRYFPDPDLVPVVVSEGWRRSVAERVPALPMERRRRFVDELGIGESDAMTLTDDVDLCLFFESCVDAAGALQVTDAGRECAKWLLNAAAKLANERATTVHELGIAPGQLAGIIELRAADRIGSSAAEQLFALLCETDDDAPTVAEAAGLLQVRDEGQLDQWVQQAIEAQPQAAEDFRSGKQAALGRLVGEVMKASHGQADAKAAGAKMRETLKGES